eukprot:TRINITY_DN4100_c0_g1_i2.p1 TRINITY_DN4100_c0_g1~~TRINITY_DN4100_c0_g1_i2.p1  ORF type:complete len:538 (+),score=165.59 TRINITY_DN4100_c0_g1_i2:35-1648(+)
MPSSKKIPTKLNSSTGNLIANSKSKYASSTSSFDSLPSQDDWANDIVKRVGGGDFSGLNDLLPKMSEEEKELLASYLVDLYEQKDLSQLLVWASPFSEHSDLSAKSNDGNEETNLKNGGFGFGKMVRNRTVFGDLGMRYFKSFFVPFHQRVEMEANTIDVRTTEGRKKVCQIMDELLKNYASSTDDSPIFLRRELSTLQKNLGRGDGPLNQILGFAMITLEKPFILSTDYAGSSVYPTKPVREVLEDCSKIWLSVAKQTSVEESEGVDSDCKEIYQSMVSKHNDSLNEFIGEYADEIAVERLAKIVASQAPFDAKREERILANLAKFLERINSSDTESVGESHYSLVEEDKERMKDKLDLSKWKAKKDGVFYWNEDSRCINARVDANLKTDLEYAADFITKKFITSNEIIKEASSNVFSENHAQYSGKHVFPFPFANRSLSINVWTCVDDTEAFVIVRNHFGEKLKGCVPTDVKISGAYLKVSPSDSSLKVSIFLHYTSEGSNPRWLCESLNSGIAKTFNGWINEMEKPFRSSQNVR